MLTQETIDTATGTWLSEDTIHKMTAFFSAQSGENCSSNGSQEMLLLSNTKV